ncbi:MAG: zinc carboxypeptidase [Bacteroidetes bacterium]|nr:MAG: zinc carboxypeptidase [Bacteroidota bacterium]
MRQFLPVIALLGLLISSPCLAQPVGGLSYYLPDSVVYDPAIPVPKTIIGHEVGEWHVTHDKLVQYMYALAKANPNRIKLERTGTTYEGREQVLLFISSASNLARLSEIKAQRQALTNAAAPEPPTATMPAVLWMGYSIHGNESSGSNASMLAAYYLAAAQGPQIEALLNQTVILLDPCFNPDGLHRFSGWANQHKSKNLVSDPNSREYNEAWPGGRFNHYWFDLNRDWMPAVHRESQNRLAFFHAWKPNVLTDHHEMGSNSTFFFQPGVPSRVNPLTPLKNQELTGKIGKYHAAFLDRIGSQYFTKEGYDDFYYGKGSTFPDIQGGIGILFEQASSRGHLQETDNGLLSFPFTIRNQFVTTLSTLEAVKDMRKELLDYQRSFYKQAATDAAASAQKAFVFGSPNDAYRSQALATMLARHGVEVHKLRSVLKSDGKTFLPATAFVVPVNQAQYKLIRTTFDITLSYADSLFYDVTAWTMPLAFGLDVAALDAAAYNPGILGEAHKMENEVRVGNVETGSAAYGYLLDWRAFEAPKAVYWLQQQGVVVKIATVPFSIIINGAEQRFEAGTAILVKQMQTKTNAEIDALVKSCAAANLVRFWPLSTGGSQTGSDVGSRYMQKIELRVRYGI